MSPFDDGGIHANARNVAVAGESAFHAFHSVNSYVTCWFGSLEQSHNNYHFFHKDASRNRHGRLLLERAR